MTVKRYEARDMTEALRLIREELGEDAMILETRKIKGGPLGLGGHERIEVLAGVEEMPEEAVAPMTREAAPRPSESRPMDNRTAEPFSLLDLRSDEDALPPSIPSIEPKPSSVISKPSSVTEPPPVVSEPSFVSEPPFVPEPPIVAEPEPKPNPFAALEARLNAKAEERPVPELENLLRDVQTFLEAQGKAPAEDPVAARLADSGMDRQLAEEVMEACGTDRSEFKLASEISRRIRVASKAATGTPIRIALVGPTGVGKTTTTAKLAAQFMLGEHKSVALITMDTYRIGAVEQLKIYARVMGLPLEVVQTPEEMAQAVRRQSDKDVILIDTVGRSPRKPEQLAEIRAFLDAAKPTEIHLVLAAPYGLDYLYAAAAPFAALNPDRLLITKLDEIPHWGIIPSIGAKTGLPVSYLTDGQEVPRNIRPASAGEIAGQILGGAE